MKKFKEKINKKYPNENLEVMDYTYAKRPATIKCLGCGEIYTIKGESFLLKSKSRVCSKCVPNKTNQLKLSILKFNNFMLKQENFKLIDYEIKGAHDTIPAICTKCGKVNYKTMYDYQRGRGCSCQGSNTLKSKEEVLRALPEDIELLGSYNGMHKKARFRHSCGFIWEATPSNIMQGKSCPKCRKKISKGEERILKFLEHAGIEFTREFTVSLEGHTLRTDFYVPALNLHIEYNGIQHYEPVKHFGGQAAFEKQIYLDGIKNRHLNILTIKYTEIDKIEEILTLTFNDYSERK